MRPWYLHTAKWSTPMNTSAACLYCGTEAQQKRKWSVSERRDVARLKQLHNGYKRFVFWTVSSAIQTAACILNIIQSKKYKQWEVNLMSAEVGKKWIFPLESCNFVDYTTLDWVVTAAYKEVAPCGVENTKTPHQSKILINHIQLRYESEIVFFLKNEQGAFILPVPSTVLLNSNPLKHEITSALHSHIHADEVITLVTLNVERSLCPQYA